MYCVPDVNPLIVIKPSFDPQLLGFWVVPRVMVAGVGELNTKGPDNVLLVQVVKASVTIKLA